MIEVLFFLVLHCGMVMERDFIYLILGIIGIWLYSEFDFFIQQKKDNIFYKLRMKWEKTRQRVP